MLGKVSGHGTGRGVWGAQRCAMTLLLLPPPTVGCWRRSAPLPVNCTLQLLLLASAAPATVQLTCTRTTVLGSLLRNCDRRATARGALENCRRRPTEVELQVLQVASQVTHRHALRGVAETGTERSVSFQNGGHQREGRQSLIAPHSKSKSKCFP